MREIQLTKGYVAMVDDEDYERLIIHRWRAKVERTQIVYAYRWVSYGRARKGIYMHTQITGHGETDHKDRNGLNNQRDNLRLATRSQNRYNTVKSKDCSSQYKGVNWDKPKAKWRVRIKVKGKSISLGYFDNEIDAAKAYNEAAIKYAGEFARTNKL